MINLLKTIKNMVKQNNFSATIQENIYMKDHTTFKIGGKAEVYVCPNSENDFVNIIRELLNENIPFFILGGGSNIVVSDEGIQGVVLSTENLTDIRILSEDESTGKTIIRASCGCSIESILQFCIENELTGLETFAGLPGTIGGAMFMNARCYDYSISDKLVFARYFDIHDSKSIQVYAKMDADWAYKKSPFQITSHKQAKVILTGDLLLLKGNKDDIEKKCDFYIKDRETKGHFKYPCAGSVFKNNRNFGKSSGEIIDSAGLKGFKIGNAEISPWHGNLIINLGGASADDIKKIVAYVQKTVKEKTGFELECEILFVGNSK